MSDHRIKKHEALARLRELKAVVEDEEIAKIHALAIIYTLVEYIHDGDIEAAVESIPL